MHALKVISVFHKEKVINLFIYCALDIAFGLIYMTENNIYCVNLFILHSFCYVVMSKSIFNQPPKMS